MDIFKCIYLQTRNTKQGVKRDWRRGRGRGRGGGGGGEGGKGEILKKNFTYITKIKYMYPSGPD